MATKSHKKKTPVPEITVGERLPTGELLTKHLGIIRQKEVEREFRRQEAAAEIARYRWQIAETAHRLEDGVSKLNFESHPFQKGIYKDESLDLVVYGSTQWGKAVRKGTRIKVPGGWRQIEDLRPGDEVVAPDGKIVKVLGVFPQGKLQLYRVTFRDGRSIEACGEHLWQIGLGKSSEGPSDWQVVNTLRARQLLDEGVSVPVPVGVRGINPRISSIEPSVVDDAVCIAVDHPSHLFVAEGEIVSHNTEFLIVDMAASAGYGLKVLVVISKMEKRNKFVAGRLDPCFGSVPIYQEMMKAAASRNAIADSTQLKHFGPGSINLIAAKSKSDFTSYAADKCQIDEHQECDLNNIKLVDDRMSGSWYGGLVRVGHPTTAGTEINQNLDWLFQGSDQRLWKVPCDECGKYQVITWWNHVVFEERHKGAVLSVRPRDEEWRPGNKFDIRPVCEECHRPMDRLHREGVWEPQKPGIARHGYKLSNLYNANKRLDEQLARYSAARHSARDMQEFVNKQLGEPWDMDGSKISESMLLDCAGGSATGILPYRFIPATHFEWRKEHAA